ncbi:hypothetical protein LTR85_003869 [Meristemomyces frigidus]|nr:hypothetical protein LTR85_003869 [Meristemomyces frigidus]
MAKSDGYNVYAAVCNHKQATLMALDGFLQAGMVTEEAYRALEDGVQKLSETIKKMTKAADWGTKQHSCRRGVSI